MNKDTTTHRNGFALPAAILSLVVIGVLVTGGFFMAHQETRIGMASQTSAQSFYLAERGLNEVLENWDASVYGPMAQWASLQASDTTADGIWDVEVTKLGDVMYLLESVATEARSGAARRMSMVAKVRTADISPPAALTTQGFVKYGGSAEIHGLDVPPDASGMGLADWSSTSACVGYGSGSDKPGLLIDDTLNIDWNGNRSQIEGNMNGTPKFEEDPSITVESLLDFGDMTWDDLVSAADKHFDGTVPTPTPSVVNGRCNIASSANWGDPLDTSSPCFNYYPIVYIGGTGTTLLNSGYGQGILLVEENLKVTGGFEWYGPVYVKGTLSTMGSGGHFWGGVVAANVDLDLNTVLGNAEIQYSSCAIERAIRLNANLSRPDPLSERSWVDASGVSGG